MEHASTVIAETKASSESFAMLEAYMYCLSRPGYHVQVFCTNKLRCTSREVFTARKV